jgi:hypothetical protein
VSAGRPEANTTEAGPPVPAPAAGLQPPGPDLPARKAGQWLGKSLARRPTPRSSEYLNNPPGLSAPHRVKARSCGGRTGCPGLGTAAAVPQQYLPVAPHRTVGVPHGAPRPEGTVRLRGRPAWARPRRRWPQAACQGRQDLLQAGAEKRPPIGPSGAGDLPGRGRPSGAVLARQFARYVGAGALARASLRWLTSAP